METSHGTQEQEGPLRIVGRSLGYKLPLALVSAVAFGFLCFMAALALQHWADGDDVPSVFFAMSFSAVLAAGVGVYVFLAHVRIYSDRIVLVALPRLKWEYYRDITRASIIQNGTEGCLLVLEGRRTIVLSEGEYRPDDLEAIYEFVRDARRNLGYEKLNPIARSEIEQRRGNYQRFVDVLIVAGVVMTAILIYFDWMQQG